MWRTTLQSPVGELHAFASQRGLRGLLWTEDDCSKLTADARLVDPKDHVIFARLAEQLGEYFKGTRQQFDLPLEFVGTEFQVAAWNALLEIPFAETRSYADQATRIGRPAAVRAVGAANGKNPISIVVPCHRVIGKDGSLTGFGGGLEVKRFLLEHESKLLTDAHSV